MPQNDDIPRTVAAMDEALTKWGMNPNDSEAAVFRSLGEVAKAVGKVPADVERILAEFGQKIEATRGLPMDKIEASIRRSAVSAFTGAAASVTHDMHWRTKAIAAGILAASVLLSAVAGYLAGYSTASDTIAVNSTIIRAYAKDSQWLANLVQFNNLTKIEDACRASHREVQGAAACTISVWTGAKNPP